MGRIPVLLLLSTNVNLDSLNSSPRYYKYQFHGYELLPEIRILKKEGEKGVFFKKIFEEVERVNPNFMIVHLGIAFEQYPVKIMVTAKKIKETFPRIKIGLDRGKRYALHVLNSTMNDKEYLDGIVNLLKYGNLIDDDPETTFLCSCLT